jgi:DNA (cytosine-5)-methyltransferase 1
VDTTPAITCVEWCFGYGGNHLGIKRVVPGLRCIAASEIEAYACANLVAKMEAGLMEPFPIWTDLKTFPCAEFHGLVDLFIASYPCTPFSCSGARAGANDPRHLWPYVRRAVEIIRPRFCFFENVEGHVSLGLREVLTELALLGYRVENRRGEPTWGIFSAAEVGAPQNRKRVFILGADSMADDQCSAIATETCRWQERIADDGRILRPESDSGRRGELADDSGKRFGEIGTEFKGRLRKPPDGGFGASGLGDTEGGRDGSISTRPGNEGTRATELDGSGQGVGQADASSAQNASGTRDNGTGRQEQRPSAGSVGLGLAESNRGGGGENREPSELRSEGSEQSSGDSRGADTREEREIAGGVGQADSAAAGLQGRGLRGHAAEHGPLFWPGFIARPGQQQHDWEPSRVIEAKRGLGGGVNGRAANVDRLRLLGNGVYPATATKAFIELMRRYLMV